MAFWQDKAALALSALLHAAALSGRTVLDIWDWANRSGDAIGGSALAHHPAASSVLRSVFAEATREGRSPDSIRMTMAKSLTWVAVPSVAAMVAGPAARPFDAARFAAVAGDPVPGGARHAGRGHRAAVPLLRGLRAAPGHPGRAPAPRPGKLDPPLLLALDEVRQIVRVPLDVWLADSAGKGVCIIAVAHGMGQLREGWGARRRRHHLGHHQQDHSARVSRTVPCWTRWPTCAARWAPARETAASRSRPSRPRSCPASRPAARSSWPAASTPVVVKLRPVWARLSSRLRLAVAPPPLSAYQELDLKVPDLEDTPQTWVDRTRPLDGVLEPAGAPDLPDWAVTDGTEDHQA